MPRKKKKAEPRTRTERLRALPWAALLQGGLVVGKRVSVLSKKDRERLMRLLRESGGRPAALTEKEREEVRKLVRKLDLRRMGGELAVVARRRGRR
jgi:hypothetical protein